MIKKSVQLRAFVCCTAFFLLLSGSASVGQEDAGRERTGLSIRVVDVREVMRNSRLWMRFQRQHLEKRETAEDMIQEYRNRLSVLEMDYEILPPGTDRADQKRREMQALIEEFQQKQEELSEDLQQNWVEGFRTFYETLRNAVESYASENEIDLVLKKQSVDLAVVNMEELGVFESADVLFAASGLDISRDIIRSVNELYAEEPE